MTNFFIFGWTAGTSPDFPSRRNEFLVEIPSRMIHIGTTGFFYFNLPWYVDVAENESVVCIKFGQIHNNSRLMTAEDILNIGWVTSSGISYEKISGNGVVLSISKTLPECFVYRNLISVPTIYFYKSELGFLITDNLRQMIDLLPYPQLNEEILPQHFIYRFVFGGKTYMRGVSELLPGENLTWNYDEIKVELKQKISDISNPERQIKVNSETSELFYSELKSVMGIYLGNNSKKYATMLSGGIDSSLLQSIINELGNDNFPTFSFVLESKTFDYEVQYTKDSINKLGTHHTFFPISQALYQESLVKSIQILGQPVPDDVRPCFYALADFIRSNHNEYSNWIHGHIADGLTGIGNSLEIVQGDKYRTWPIGLLMVLGKLLNPFSQSKSYGALMAAKKLSFALDINSPDNHLNSVGQYTDWYTVRKCFDDNEITKAFAEKRKMIDIHMNSRFLVENTNTLDLLTDGLEPASLTRQLGLYCGGEYIFPYGDGNVVKAVYAYEPISRYVYLNQVKPILRMALGSRLPLKSLTSPKGWSGVGNELWTWMREGSMKDLVWSIDRQGFISKVDLEIKLQNPDWFTWNLLTLDLFKKSLFS